MLVKVYWLQYFSSSQVSPAPVNPRCLNIKDNVNNMITTVLSSNVTIWYLIYIYNDMNHKCYDMMIIHWPENSWTKAIWGWFPFLTIIPVTSQRELILIYLDESRIQIYPLGETTQTAIENHPVQRKGHNTLIHKLICENNKIKTFPTNKSLDHWSIYVYDIVYYA